MWVDIFSFQPIYSWLLMALRWAIMMATESVLGLAAASAHAQCHCPLSISTDLKNANFHMAPFPLKH